MPETSFLPPTLIPKQTVLLLLLLVGCSVEQIYLPPEKVGRYQLEAIPAELADGELTLRDLDGDEVPELLLSRKLELALFRADRSSRSIQRWRRRTLSAAPFHRQWADGRLLLFSEDGVSAYDPLTDRLVVLIEAELSRFEVSEGMLDVAGGVVLGQLQPYWVQVSGQMLLPVDGDWLRFVERDGKWVVVDRFRLPVAADEKGRLQLLRHAWRDLDGDGQVDLVIHGKKAAYFYYRKSTRDGSAGSLPREPTFVLESPQTQLADLNDDGFVDLLAVRSEVGEPGEVRVFLGHPRRRAWRQPEQTLSVPGFFRMGPLLTDRNEDKQIDLTFISIEKPSILGTAFKLIFRGRFDLSLNLLHYDGVEGGYPEAPSEIESVTIPIDISKLKAQGDLLKKRVAHLGDLEGDGRPDLILLSQDGRQLELYYNFKSLSGPVKVSSLWAGLQRARDMLLGLQEFGDRRPDVTIDLPGGPYSSAQATPVKFSRSMSHPDLILQVKREGAGKKARLFVLWSEK